MYYLGTERMKSINRYSRRLVCALSRLSRKEVFRKRQAGGYSPCACMLSGPKRYFAIMVCQTH